MSVLNGRGRGDLVARMLVETPTRLSSKQKKILEEFRETETGDECPAAEKLLQPREGHARRLGRSEHPVEDRVDFLQVVVEVEQAHRARPR